MRLPGFSRVFLALWLAIAALAGNAFEQHALGFNIIAATAETDSHAASAFHVMPDGTVMAGRMASGVASSGHDVSGGHTHKGHADCDLCGFIANMASFTMASLTVLPQPPETFTVLVAAAPDAQLIAARTPPYASRAPPAQMI